MSRKARMSDDEKRERKAARITARDKAAAPLFAFAGLVPETTAADVYWKSRRDWARAGEGGDPTDPAVRGVEWLRVWAIERFALALLGDDFAAVHAAVREHSAGVPEDCPASVADQWFGLLTGLRCVTLGYRRLALGQVVTDRFPEAGPRQWLTRDEYLSRFPPGAFPHKLGSDDPTGLFDRTIGVLTARTVAA